MNDQIINIDDYVHVVNGKAICFTKQTFDLQDEYDVKNLLLLSEGLYVEKTLPKYFGKYTVCVLVPFNDGSKGHFVTIIHAECVDSDKVDIVKKACEEYQ